jgi:hypothetical protein
VTRDRADDGWFERQLVLPLSTFVVGIFVLIVIPFVLDSASGVPLLVSIPVAFVIFGLVVAAAALAPFRDL